MNIHYHICVCSKCNFILFRHAYLTQFEIKLRDQICESEIVKDESNYPDIYTHKKCNKALKYLGYIENKFPLPFYIYNPDLYEEILLRIL